jgi:hypothetical protein
MTLLELNDFMHYECSRPQDEWQDYKIIVAGHPGEIGTTFHKNSIIINEDDKTIVIWI